MFEKAIFMIEGGKALDLVKAFIAERIRVSAEVRALAKELGVEHIYTSRATGVLTGVQFKDKVHPDFKKPDRKGISFPKKGSEWEKRLREQVGHQDQSAIIANAFNVPLSISYSDDAGSGVRCLGVPFTECGFLYLGADGPYAMWVPDVPAEVAHSESRGYTVGEPAKSFKLEFEGCRRIEREEWEILVAQQKLDEKRAAKAAA